MLCRRIVEDDELKLSVGGQLPYADWVKGNLVPVSALSAAPAVPYAGVLRDEALLEKLRVFGYSNETLSLLLLPMVSTKKEALGSMGNDAVLWHSVSIPDAYLVLLTGPRVPIESATADLRLLQATLCTGSCASVASMRAEQLLRVRLPIHLLTQFVSQWSCRSCVLSALSRTCLRGLQLSADAC